ncbi:alkaline-phosphatase-like protein [Catenaria anguillulae PL171]|uniref:Alkaline phosphatase n=1 Tax=Catenaria anguillulae PL171 TaxID=765915 RepID=A0A1Y2I1N4_9FUNG|nr:alkaline-phosphatase-like protein [Catenaria anguillulae PL171]
MKLSLLALLVLVASVSAQEPAYGKRPTPQPAPQPADVCESPLKLHHPESKVLGKWAKYTGKPQTNRRGCRPKKNFIFMVSDGFGSTSETIAREFYQYAALGDDKKAIDDLESILPLDTLLVGAARTKSSSSWVTDSASAATALAAGKKTYNAAVGVDSKQIPVATVLEAAKHHGFVTGVVATSRATHATPAGWTAHVADRDSENHIAAQQIGDNPLGRSADLIFGGGKRHFIPKSVKGSKRDDERDLLKEAREKYSWKTIADSRDQLVAMPKTKAALPALGVFASSNLDYEIDRNVTAQPSLAEMADAALTILADASSECDSPGFFIMIEGSRIDHAAHTNDAATHIHEIWHTSMLCRLSSRLCKPTPTLVPFPPRITKRWCDGRLASRPVRGPDDPLVCVAPGPNRQGQGLIEKVGPMITGYKGDDVEAHIRKVCADFLGVSDVTAAEMKELVQGRADAIAKKYGDAYVFPMDIPLAKLMSVRALVGFTTNGHTAADVNVYAINAPGLRGHMDNTYLAKYSAEFIGVWASLPKLSKRLAGIDIGPQPKKKRSVDSSHNHH